MNNGFFWSPDATADLAALSRDAFFARYPGVSTDAYRQRRAKAARDIEDSSPVQLPVDKFTPSPWLYEPRVAIQRADAERHVNIGDTHGMFVDQTVWKAVLDFIREFKPSQINCLGDMVDFYDASRYLQDPNRKFRLWDEIKFTREVVFAEIRRAAPKARIVWVGGNHEARLRKYLWSRAPELSALPALEIPALFDLPKLRVEFTTENIQVGDTHLTHGHLVRKESGMTARAMQAESGGSIIHNHTHRLGAFYKTDRDSTYVAFENGCLCSMSPEYISGVVNWQHGFSYGWLLPSGRFHLVQTALIDGEFVSGGKFFGSTDPIEHCHD